MPAAVRRLFRYAALSVTLPALAAAQRGAEAPCARPAPRPAAATLVLASPASYPCRIASRDLPVALRPAETGGAVTIGYHTARDSRGRYYTTSGFGTVDVWDSAGRHLRAFGRQGEGPGELAKGIATIAIDPQDNIYIRDARFRWSVFGPDDTFLRSFLARDAGVEPAHSQFVAPFQMVTTEWKQEKPRGEPHPAFTILDFSGAPDRTSGTPPVRLAFGTLPSSPRRDGRLPARPLSPVLGGEFWAAPPAESGTGYELQLWGVDGKLRRTLRRDVPWFRAGEDGPPSPPEHVQLSQATAPKPSTRVLSVRALPDGLLFVAVSRANARWDSTLRHGDTPAQRAAFFAMMRRGMDFHLEVIDTRANTVLASEGPLTADQFEGRVPTGWFDGWSGYRRVTDADGVPSMVMTELRLVAKP